MTDFTTDNIHSLRAKPLGSLLGWEVSFISDNAGMHHQLYVNGRLADFSDTPDQRRFTLELAGRPARIVVAATSAANRAIDRANFLPTEHRRLPWMYQAAVLPSGAYQPGWRLEVLDDHATGVMDSMPLLTRDFQPAWQVPWAWGQDAFGRGGFGLDATTAPGFGSGAFGGGPFGADGLAEILTVALAEEGTHQIVIRATGPDGQVRQTAVQHVQVNSPPQTARSLAATAYDPVNHVLSLHIE
jgi:hypothetical protein